LLSLELFQSIPGTKYFGEFEERLQNKKFKNLPLKKLYHLSFLFLDEVHTLEGDG